MATLETGQIAPRNQALSEVRLMLGREAKTVEAVLGRYMPVERFLGSIVTLVHHNPDLMTVNRDSLKLAVLRIAQLQLSPDPALGQAWIIPRKGRAEFQLGWKGCLALAYRSPLVASVRYNVVGKEDRFTWTDGRNWVLEHEPCEEGWPSHMDDVRAVWAIIELRSGLSIPRVMYRAEVLRHKSRGQGSQPAWATDPAAMALKTVIADACRRGPFEGEIGRAFSLDHQGEVGLGQPSDEPPAIPVTPVPAAEGAGSALLDKLKAAHGIAPQESAVATPFDGEADPEPIREPDYEGGPIAWEGAVEDDEEPLRAAFMTAEQVGRIRDFSVQKGLSDLALQALIGGRPEDQPAADETRILALLRDHKSPSNGRRAK